MEVPVCPPVCGVLLLLRMEQSLQTEFHWRCAVGWDQSRETNRRVDLSVAGSKQEQNLWFCLWSQHDFTAILVQIWVYSLIFTLPGMF